MDHSECSGIVWRLLEPCAPDTKRICVSRISICCQISRRSLRNGSSDGGPLPLELPLEVQTPVSGGCHHTVDFRGCVRSKASGHASLQMQFSHWEVLDEDPFPEACMTEEVRVPLHPVSYVDGTWRAVRTCA